MTRTLLICIGLAFACNALAQQRAGYSNFLLNDYYYNPAIAGSKNVHVANLTYRNQWVGFDGAPTLMMGNFYGSVKNRGKMGYGVSLISEGTGITQNTTIYLNYAHHFKLTEHIKLGLGIQPGYMQYRVRLYDAQLADQGDEVLTGTVYPASAVDVSSGFNLYSDKFFLMGSAHHLLGKSIQFTSYNSNLQFHYNLIAGYNIKFKKKKFELQPSLMIKYTRPVPVQITGMLRGTFKDKFWLGFLYRTDDAVGVSLGMKVHERFSVGYGYDYTLSKLSNHQSGSHEVMLSFIITKNKPTLEEEDDKLNNSILEDMKKKMEEEKKNK
ncbi:MAG: type IX secretion system membrane protein PorP/SprF [Crocinitomicaceae bacterium]|nr:type IX secretion system membrane protein PorP/SprF [Crocinitomicaceae bacterium]